MEISVEEMARRIEEHCNRRWCSDCRLRSMKESSCYVGLKDDIIKRNYNILFGNKSDDSAPKNKHPFNSTEIISIKRKKKKLFLRYVDENGKVFKVSASCHKDDEFNIVDGLKVLTDKLDGKIKKENEPERERIKPFTFVVLKTDDSWKDFLTKGKLYRTNDDGIFTYDDGHHSLCYKNYENFIKDNPTFIPMILQIVED